MTLQLPSDESFKRDGIELGIAVIQQDNIVYDMFVDSTLDNRHTFGLNIGFNMNYFNKCEYTHLFLSPSNGHRCVVYDKNKFFEGNMVNGIPHGKGALRCHNWLYVGDFYDGRIHGQGKLYVNDKLEHEGYFQTKITHKQSKKECDVSKVTKNLYMKKELHNIERDYDVKLMDKASKSDSEETDCELQNVFLSCRVPF